MKKTWLERLREVFSNNEGDVEIDLDELASTVESLEENEETNSNQSKTDNKKEDKKVVDTDWFNEETGEADLSKISDPVVLKAIKQYKSRAEGIENRQVIEKEIAKVYAESKVKVSQDSFSRLLGIDKLEIIDGKIKGLSEAIESLKKAEPNIFDSGKTDSKKEASNPISEGFNPVQTKGTTGVPKSFEEAMAMSRAINEINN